MSIKEQICTEIERLKKNAESAKQEWNDGHYNQNAFAEDCRIKSFNKLLAFIDSLPEQPVEGLEEAADAHIRRVADAAGHPGWDWTTQDIAEAFIAGVKWQAEQFEKNRLAACDAQTEEEYERETDFAYNFIEEHHRMPTFNDAINYGIEWQKEHGKI